MVSLRTSGHAGEVRNEVLAARSMLANISDFVLVLSRDFEKLKEIGESQRDPDHHSGRSRADTIGNSGIS